MRTQNTREKKCVQQKREKRKERVKINQPEMTTLLRELGRESCTIPYGPFLRDTVVLQLRNASTYNFRTEIERNEFTTFSPPKGSGRFNDNAKIERERERYLS